MPPALPGAAMTLRDRVVIVTGAGGGIGRSIALERRGCHFAFADIAPRQRAPLTTQCGGHSQSAEPLARPDAFALCSIASIGARSRSP